MEENVAVNIFIERPMFVGELVGPRCVQQFNVAGLPPQGHLFDLVESHCFIKGKLNLILAYSIF